jgi:hypothetical protein
MSLMAKINHIFERRWLGILLLGAFFVSTPALIAYAAVSINHPASGFSITSKYSVRSDPFAPGKLDAHKGVDYGTPVGTVINLVNGTAPKAVACEFEAGYGKFARVQYECDVELHYGHLLECNASGRSVVTGGAKGNPNSGSSTGPHLHYTMKLGNARVDAEKYFEMGSPDLCNQDVRKQLIDDANAKAKGLAGKDGTIAPVQDGGSSTHVPGSSNDGTGTVIVGGDAYNAPTRGGYSVITMPDGRVIIVPDESFTPDDGQVLPPGDAANLTPEGKADHEVTGCATDTWKAMVNQSVLQARREMAMNQRFVAKPDSVLAYSCLHIAMDKVRENLGPVFSETKRWVNVEVDILGKTVTLNKELGESSLDGALVNAAYDPYERWLNANFNHDFLGGLVEGGHSGHDAHPHDQGYSGCATMQDVWKAAKCMNMTDSPMFPRFEDLINNDPRNYPHGMSCNNTGITQDMINIAKGTQVKFDKIETHFDILLPGEDEDGNVTCHPPIRTGVKVIRMESEAVADCNEDDSCFEKNAQEGARISKPKEYEDGICVTVGCSYQNKEAGLGECLPERAVEE